MSYSSALCATLRAGLAFLAYSIFTRKSFLAGPWPSASAFHKGPQPPIAAAQKENVTYSESHSPAFIGRTVFASVTALFVSSARLPVRYTWRRRSRNVVALACGAVCRRPEYSRRRAPYQRPGP